MSQEFDSVLDVYNFLLDGGIDSMSAWEYIAYVDVQGTARLTFGDTMYDCVAESSGDIPVYTLTVTVLN